MSLFTAESFHPVGLAWPFSSVFLGLNQTSEGLPRNLKTPHFSGTSQRAEVTGQPTDLKSKGSQEPPRRRGP